tara:strand:+ start:557 stop:1114 length:558 start_codon:yes stop_codon:yes gene_type:complete
VRIISGKFKKSKIISPGKLDVRPTSNRAKEMIFSTLESILIKENTSFNDSNVLDGFCGTGSLGIETISRGAKFVTFIDNSSKSLRIVKENCKNLNILSQCNFYKLNLAKKVKINKKFDIFFLDAPYKRFISNCVISNLVFCKLLQIGSIGIVETFKKEEISESNNVSLIKIKMNGNSKFSFIKII